MVELTITHTIISVLSFLLGLFTGFLLWNRAPKDNHAKYLTQLQVVAIPMFFGYIIITTMLDREPSEFVLISILAILGGEAAGAVFARAIERNRKK